jgi:hypothetical protein
VRMTWRLALDRKRSDRRRLAREGRCRGQSDDGPSILRTRTSVDFAMERDRCSV